MRRRNELHLQDDRLKSRVVADEIEFAIDVDVRDRSLVPHERLLQIGQRPLAISQKRVTARLRPSVIFLRDDGIGEVQPNDTRDADRWILLVDARCQICKANALQSS